MFKPARMTRILVGGHREHMADAVKVLHEEQVVHLEDYRDATGVTGMGSPTEEGAAVSDLLLRVRGLQRAIEVEGARPKEMATDDPAGLTKKAEQAIVPVMDRLADARTRLAALEAERRQVEPLAGLDVHLGALTGLDALKGYIGTVREDPRPGLAEAGLDHDGELHGGRILVLLVRRGDGATADRVLAEHGFVAAQLPPDVDGTPDEAVARLDARMTGLRKEIGEQEQKQRALQEKWGRKLAALERFLTAEAQRSAAPLHFGVTDNTFHLEGWVPSGRLNRLQNVLAGRFGDSLYVEALGDAPRSDVAAPLAGAVVAAAAPGPDGGNHDDHHGDDSAAHAPDGSAHGDHEGHDDHHEVAVEDEAPTQLDNKGPSKDYQFMLGLLALPRYRELDPTKLIAIFFPLFFGLMVGDVVIGLLIMGVAWWLRSNRLFGIGGDGVAKPMMWGGLWAVIIGAFLFGEGLGLHFVLSEEALADGEHSWESVLGFQFPDEGFLHKTGGDSVAHAVADGGDGLAPHAEGSTVLPTILQPHGGAHLSVGGWVNLGYYSKVHDVQPLLIWSVIIGLLHLVLGFVLGVRNVYVSHGLKLAVQEKVSWLLIIASVPAIILGMQGANTALMWGGVGVFVAAVALLWMGVQHTIGVGFIALLEIPSLLGNLLSYTRLAAIGASKAGMAIAFATMGFELIGGPAGFVVYLLASLLITVLAILAGFLQSLRLQFVEFFSKFYEGGGRPYVPFGRRAA